MNKEIQQTGPVMMKDKGGPGWGHDESMKEEVILLRLILALLTRRDVELKAHFDREPA